ncbi:hypothetical protein BDR22DRAFT_816699 [Usnea florida]
MLEGAGWEEAPNDHCLRGSEWEECVSQREREVRRAQASTETAVPEEKRGSKRDEEYANAAAVRKEERFRAGKRKKARKWLLLFSDAEMPDGDAKQPKAARKQAVPELFES